MGVRCFPRARALAATRLYASLRVVNYYLLCYVARPERQIVVAGDTRTRRCRRGLKRGKDETFFNQLCRSRDREKPRGNPSAGTRDARQYRKIVFRTGSPRRCWRDTPFAGRNACEKIHVRARRSL